MATQTYSGQFRSLHRNTLYKIQIDCSVESTGSVVDDLSLGPEPFITSMDGGSNTIYVPVKYTGATVQVVADEYYFDMYSRTPKQNSVKLYKVNSSSNQELIWTGYTSPNVYSADYNFVTETWDVECIDGLSVLKYYDYKPIFNNSMSFVTFTQIINYCLTKCGCYTDWYFSKGTYKTNYSNYPLTNGLTISEANFFDEDMEPMKLNEVFEEVCKYCGVTAVAYGSSVYFIDYDSIVGSNATGKQYFHFTVANPSNVQPSPDSSTLAACQTHTLTNSSYSSSGSSLSLDNVYSKVTIRDNFYTVKSIIPSMFEDEDLDNIKYVDESTQNWNWEYTQQCCDLGENTYDSKANEDNTYYYMKSRYYTNKKYNHYFYYNDGRTYTGKPITSNDPDSSTAVLELTEHTGALFSRFNISSAKTRPEAMNGLDYGEADNYLMIPMNHSDTAGLKRLESKDEEVKPFFVPSNACFLVKGSLILTDRANFNSFEPTDYYKPDLFSGKIEIHRDTSVGYFPNADGFKGDFDGGGWWIFYTGNSIKMTQNNLTLRVDVSIDGNAVRNDVAFYPLGQGDASIAEDRKNHEIFFKSFDVQNNVSYNDNISEKGFKLNLGITNGEVVPAKPIISIYGMDQLQTLFGTFMPTSPIGCIFIKDFDIQAVMPHEGGKDENDTNTEYSYVIDDDYVQELSPIEFKICTFDNKQLNYSSVAWNDSSTGKQVNSGKLKFVDTLTNRPLNLTKCSEWLMCYKIVHQYQKPAKKLSVSLFEENIRPWTKITEPSVSTYGNKLASGTFIVDTVSYNYALDTASCTLVEKQ